MTERPARITRRTLLKHSAGAALAAPYFVPSKSLGDTSTVAPSERITLGAIGIGRRGEVDLKSFLTNSDVQFVAIADVRKQRREAVKEIADSHHGNKDCAMYSDMFELLARDDIDAVLIATGDRWHTLASVIAAKAGKDIYSEKPCSMTIQESRILADTMRRYGRVYQAGTQRRSIGNFMFAADLVHSGKLGRIHTVHANTLKPGTVHTWLPAQTPPPKDVVDWDRWLGPCPWRPYNEKYIGGGWRWHFDFHGGGILEWGSHTVDLCQWAAQKDDTAPVEYVPNETGVDCTYADGVKLVMRDHGWLGLGTCSARYEGDEGWIETGDSGRMAVYPESLRSKTSVFKMPGTAPDTHIRNFLNCVKTRRQLRANADVVAQSHIVCHAAYIAWQLGRTVRFDPKTEQFIDDDDANRMTSRAMREPWHV